MITVFILILSSMSNPSAVLQLHVYALCGGATPLYHVHQISADPGHCMTLSQQSLKSIVKYLTQSHWSGPGCLGQLKRRNQHKIWPTYWPTSATFDLHCHNRWGHTQTNPYLYSHFIVTQLKLLQDLSKWNESTFYSFPSII